MPRSFARTQLKISLTSGRGRPAEVKITTRSRKLRPLQELSAISAFIQARVRSPLTKCKNRGCARRSHPRTYLCYDSKIFTRPSAKELWLLYSTTRYQTIGRHYGCFTRRHVIRLSDDLPLLTGGRRGPLPSPRKGLLPTTDRNICPPDFARVILFHGLSFSHLPPFNQQPRGLYSLFILTILFPCAQDCDHGAQSVSVSLPRNWVLLGRTVTFYAILQVVIIFFS